MDTVCVNVRPRLVRFALMVRPEDRANPGEIFRINTCLWGGLYNPTIPSGVVIALIAGALGNASEIKQALVS